MDEMNQKNLPAQEDCNIRMKDLASANEYLYQVLDIGQYMLHSGGEISRVEDSIQRMCLALGAERADVFTITSCIHVTIYAHRFGAVTQIRRVKGTEHDLHRLEMLNALSRRICAEKLSMEEIQKSVEMIHSEKQYGLGAQLLIYALVSSSFALFFGGSLGDAMASGVVGVLLKYLDNMIRKTEANGFLSALICSCLGGLLATLAVRIGFGDSLEMISIGNIMLLIPGIALTNSLRDMFSGNPMSGLLRFLEAVILAMVIALGFALVASMV